MPLTTDSINWLFDWIQQPTWKLAGLIFVNGLWIPLAWMILREIWESFQFWTAGMYSQQKRTFIFLAVDVPREAEQTPASMEAIFTQLAGSHGTSTWWEDRWQGEFQEWFSFEIVSLEGYVQYIIRTTPALRDIIEASIYAQYPDAEISEVKDYTQDVPSEWPNDEWDYFGTEYLLGKSGPLPIRTYHEFEDKIRGELVDPMAALLEIMSKIGKGEQIWYQLLIKPVTPSDDSYAKDAEKEINKITERETAPEKPSLIGRPLFWLTDFISNLLGGAAGAEAGDSKDELARSPMFKLTPGERTLLEEVERKSGKLSYRCRIRIAYFGKKEVFNKAKGAGAVVGAIKQFNDDSKNWFKVGKTSWTKANYAFKRARKYQRMNSFYKAYSSRTMYGGEVPGGFILNTEELATIYHFPMASVKAPLVKRTGAKKSEPPPTLPIETDDATRSITIKSAPEPPGAASESVAAAPPAPEAVAPGSAMTLPSAEDVQFVEIPDSAPAEQPPQETEPADAGGPPPNLPIG